MRIRALVAVAAVMVLAACEGAPSDPAAGLELQAAGASAVSKLTGGGQFELLGVIPVNFNYDVTGALDGSASGNFRLYFEADGAVVDFEGTASCLSVDDTFHRGWVGGVVTANRSTHPAFVTPITVVGADVWFRVVDYGEGRNAAADRSTTFGFRGSAGILTSADYCLIRPWPDGDARTWPVVKGNIQVR